MLSEVALCNAALFAIGAEPITSLSDDSSEAAFCKNRYADLRDAVLVSHPWNCALTKASLAQDATDPIFGYTYRYALPTDPYCLRVLKMDGQDTYDWRVVAGRYLETDYDVCKIEYIARVTDPLQFSMSLGEAISARIAVEAAAKLMEKPSAAKRKEMWDEYVGKLAQAMALDAQESHEFDNGSTDDAWVTARQ